MEFDVFKGGEGSWGLSLKTYFFRVISYGVCLTTPGVCGDKLVSLGGGGQGNSGESPEEGTGDGLKLEGEELQCQVGGGEHAESGK